MPKISVIVPVYNVEKYLEQCLESIRTQTLKDIEIICINDGSTDNSLQILKEYCARDKRFQLISRENRGYGATINEGIAQAQGDYIGIVESDDYIQPDMYEELYFTATENDAEVVKGNYYCFKMTDGIEEKQECENLAGCPYDRLFSPLEYIQIFKITPSIWSAIYSREFLIKNHITVSQTKGASYQDTSFAFKVYQCAQRFYCIKDSVINYRIDNPDSSVHNPLKIYCICDEAKEIINFVEQYGGKNRDNLYAIAQTVIFKVYLWNYNRLIIPYQYAFLQVMEWELKASFAEHSPIKAFWSEETWAQAHEIIEDKDAFYDRTGKYNQELRRHELEKCNEVMLAQGFFSMLQDARKVCIYGAGKIARRVYAWMQEIGYAEKVAFFVVTSKNENASTIDNIPVISVNEVKEDGTLILLGVSERYRSEVVTQLQQRNLKRYIIINDKVTEAVNEMCKGAK